MFSYAQIIAWLLQYRYAVIFPIMVVEGPIITVIASFLASQGYFNVFVVYLMSIAGDLTGDSLYYVIGRWGRKLLIRRWGHYIGLTPARMGAAEHYFEHHAGKTLITAKLTHGAGFFALFAAGASHMPYWKFLWYNFLGNIPKSLIFVVIGFYFGYMYAQIDSYLYYLSLIVIVIVLATVFLLYARQKKRKRSPASDMPA